MCISTIPASILSPLASLMSAATTGVYEPFVPTAPSPSPPLLIAAYAATTILLLGFSLRLYLTSRRSAGRINKLKTKLKQG